MVFDKIKRAFSGSDLGDEFDNEYIELDLGREEQDNKVFVKLFAKVCFFSSNGMNPLRPIAAAAAPLPEPVGPSNKVEKSSILSQRYRS